MKKRGGLSFANKSRMVYWRHRLHIPPMRAHADAQFIRLLLGWFTRLSPSIHPVTLAITIPVPPVPIYLIMQISTRRLLLSSPSRTQTRG